MSALRSRTGLAGHLHGRGHVVRPAIHQPALITSSRSWRRHGTSEAGENKSGHISCTPNEGIIFFGNLALFNLGWTSASKPLSELIQTKSRIDTSGSAIPVKTVEEAVKDHPLGISKVEVVEVLPRYKEGGAFLKFTHDDTTDAATVAKAVRDHLKKNQTRPWWWPFHNVRAGLVLGKPWVEDLFRTPSERLRVEFLPSAPGGEVAELSQEQLYSFFRPYGKLADIVPQASDSKVVPRFAYVDFHQIRRAIMAKNCLHGYAVSEEQGGGKLGTILRLTYEKKQRFGWIKDWIFGHPRLVIPLFAALIAGISLAIFDPVRTASIKAHVSRTFHFEDNAIFRWFKMQSEDLINRVRRLGSGDFGAEPGMQVVWDDRKTEIEQIQSWLMETAETFIIVQGPRGSGKKELVLDHALKHKREAHRVLVVDCKPIQEARGDAATINAVACQTGYWPVFSWMNSFSTLLDLASQSLTGVKGGFSDTLDNQLTKIWNNTTAALKSIALDARKKNDKDKALSEDEFLDAHPERRPIVVIDNFLHKGSEAGAELIYDKIADWAARLTTSNIAHVIFLTNDVSFSKSLSKAMPDRVFHQIALGDTSPEVAKQYVIQHLDFDANPSQDKSTSIDGEETRRLTPSQKRKDLRELDEVIPLLGGRLTDLEFLARRIKTGETPSKAANEIVEQSSSEIIKMFLLSSSENRDWNSAQAWTLVRSLAAAETLRYNEVLLFDAFKAGKGEQALAALEQAELISVQSSNGRPYSIKPGRPVYQPAFQRLLDDHVLVAKMDLALLTEAIATANKTVEKCEQELKVLGDLPKQPAEIAPRIKWLLQKINSNQNKVEGWERESVALTKVLTSEF